MQTDHWLPTSRHIKDLLLHAEDVTSSRLVRAPSIALILIDNSIELLLREYLNYYKQMDPIRVKRLKFHQLLHECSELEEVQYNGRNFTAFHHMRNEVYHTGSLTPVRKDVKSFLSFARKLFDEIHPQHKLKKDVVVLPSKETVEKLFMKRAEEEVAELTAITLVADRLENEGYDILVQPKIGQRRADIMATKGNKIVVCELKMRPGFHPERALGQVVMYKRDIGREFPSSEAEYWLIVSGKVKDSDKEAARSLGIKLLGINEFKGSIS